MSGRPEMPILVPVGRKHLKLFSRPDFRFLTRPPSSRGPGHRPLTAATGVRIPLGVIPLMHCRATHRNPREYQTTHFALTMHREALRQVTAPDSAPLWLAHHRHVQSGFLLFADSDARQWPANCPANRRRREPGTGRPVRFAGSPADCGTTVPTAVPRPA